MTDKPRIPLTKEMRHYYFTRRNGVGLCGLVLELNDALVAALKERDEALLLSKGSLTVEKMLERERIALDALGRIATQSGPYANTVLTARESLAKLRADKPDTTVLNNVCTCKFPKSVCPEHGPVGQTLEKKE